MLKETFIGLVKKYADNNDLVLELWAEIEASYSADSRYYHTLKHLENLLEQLNLVKNEIQNFETILFTLFYHDIIYNPLKSDNEEKSAELAEKRMKHLAVPGELIERCKAQILATKSHDQAAHSDTNYFTDADLSVLGQSWEVYSRYSESVRREYAVYPDSVYNPGRKKVLLHFLSMERIFKTAYFYAKFEQQAKHNLQREAELL